MTEKTNGVLIHQMELGPMQNFLYFLGDDSSKEVALVDAGWEAPAIRLEAERLGLNITKILLTHGHPDHIDALEQILEYFPVPVYLSQEEAPYYRPNIKELKNLRDQDTITIGAISVTCLHTPGHTPGGICFYTPGHLLAGDTLFIDSCGRVDLPGGDQDTLLKSIRSKIFPLPDETIIYPGHNYHSLPYDTLAHQKKTNPFLR